MNLKQLESRAATLGVHVMYSKDLPPKAAVAIEKGENWYIVMSN